MATLSPNESLTVNETINSLDGRFRLIMQPDSNLVLYKVGERPLWASNTVGANGTRATMQEDGNLVMYDPTGKPIWATNTAGNHGASLLVQNDGNTVVYASDGRPLWATNTFEAGYVATVSAGGANFTASINGVTALDIKNVVEPLLPALLAIAKGNWRLWKVSVPDLGLGFDALPVGVEVCLDKKSFDTLRSTVSWGTLKLMIDLLGGVVSAGGVEKAAALILAGLTAEGAAAITKCAGVLGITVGQAFALVLVLLIIVTYQLTAIVAQVKGREFFGETFKNGLCLQHPVIALGAIGVITAPTTVGPFLAAQLAVNTPILVVPR